ncbi:MAG TPA: ammonium transporter [Candidatus Acidoferrum sp.]|nr:ammonium transporter [Candidatus Acidoferrum sp.]
MKRMGLKCCLMLAMVLGAVPLSSRQTTTPAATPSSATPASSTRTPPISRELSARLDDIDQKVAAAQSAGDNAWMLVSAALVLLMTGPGLALFYGGLVRRKNALAIMMQSFAMMGLITVLWALVGYSLCFGGSGPIIGDFAHAFLRGVGVAPNPDYAGTIPQLTFMVYQLMFAVITPALITGATAERMKFSGTVLFMTLWFLIVYAPLAHMVWGKGGLLNANGGRFPCLDFAGGTVVHISSGVSALVCALYMGKRVGFPKQPMPPHSLVLSFIGACLLWVGWFGFNAGSALAASGLASSAFVATHFGAAGAAFSWSAAEWIKNGKASALGAISGAVAGLVAITPAAGFVAPIPALIIGLIAGVCCYLMVTKVKAIFGYDDALDAFGVHGAGGTIGALLTGVFAQSIINPIFGEGKSVGGLDGHWGQIGNQLVGVLIAWGLALVGTIAIAKVTDMITGFRASEEHEVEGLDVTQHGEEAYYLES